MLKTYIVNYERFFTQRGYLIIKAEDEEGAREISKSEDAYTGVQWENFRTSERYPNDQDWVIRDPQELTVYRVILAKGIQPPATIGIAECRLSVGELPLGCDVWYVTVEDRKHWEHTLLNAYRSNDALLGYSIVGEDEKESNV